MEENREHVPVRRRRRRRPKWQRVLHKYWPPIRFGMICLLLLFLIAGSVKLVINLVTTADPSAKKPQSTEPSTTVEVTLSPEEIAQINQELMADADFIAAGYDYQKAISMLKASKYYDSTPELQAKVQEYERLDGQLVSYDQMNNITHIFFHSLIVDTSRAFDTEYTAGGYNQYMTTVTEFNAILESMYEKGYVLVSPYDIAYEVTDSTGTHFTYGDIRLPAGKTPFVMSQDDLNYYGYMSGDVASSYERPAVANKTGDGVAHKVVIDENGYPTCEYIDAEGNVKTGDYDLVPLLERFIQAHPDFSYHGARAILGMTGYEGVFGYRTKPAYEEKLGTEAYQKEVADAKAVEKCLRSHGGILASHSYGHPSYGELTADRVEQDSDKWENTVQPIIGDVDVILYPNGSDIAGIEKYTTDNAKFNALYADGYRYFYNVDSNYAWCQLGDNYFRGGRRNLDGYRMYYNPDALSDLFDVSEVWDPARPTPVPPI